MYLYKNEKTQKFEKIKKFTKYLCVKLSLRTFLLK